jgi:hypothetical protein
MSRLGEKCNIHALDLFAREAGALVTGVPPYIGAFAFVVTTTNCDEPSNRAWRTL